MHQITVFTKFLKTPVQDKKQPTIGGFPYVRVSSAPDYEVVMSPGATPLKSGETWGPLHKINLLDFYSVARGLTPIVSQIR